MKTLCSFLFLFPMLVSAHIFSPEDCTSLANDAVTFAEHHRDAPQALYEHDLLALNMVLSMSMGSPNSYVKDEQDRKYVVDVFAEVSHSDWTPGQAYDHEYASCMKKVQPELPKGEKRSGPQLESMTNV